ALEQLHHEVGRAVREVAEVGDGGDVRVAYARRRLRLADEALDDRLHARELGAEHLDRHALAEPLVRDLVDDAHAAAADDALDEVAIVDAPPYPGVGRRRVLERRRTRLASVERTVLRLVREACVTGWADAGHGLG